MHIGHAWGQPEKPACETARRLVRSLPALQPLVHAGVKIGSEIGMLFRPGRFAIGERGETG